MYKYFGFMRVELLFLIEALKAWRLKYERHEDQNIKAMKIEEWKAWTLVSSMGRKSAQIFEESKKPNYGSLTHTRKDSIAIKHKGAFI